MSNIKLLKKLLSKNYVINEQLDSYLFDLVNKQTRILDGLEIVHSHHIVPTFMGGEDSDYNKVTLTIKEHLEYHLKLADCFEEGAEERNGNLWSANMLQKYVADENFNIDLSGDKNPMFGKKHSEETKIKIGEKSKLKVYDDLYREKLRYAFTGDKNPMSGRHHSIETRRKISESQIGKKRKPHSKETKKKMRESNLNKVRVKKYDMNGVLLDTYDSIKEASILNSVGSANLSGYFKKTKMTEDGKYRHLGGFVWRYINEEF